MEIIIKSKKERYVPLIRKKHPIGKENRTDFRWEKRAKELHRMGYNEEAISGMMGQRNFSENWVRSTIKKENKKEMVLDGKL